MTLERDLEIKADIVDQLVAMAGDGLIEDADHFLGLYVLTGKLDANEAIKCWDYMDLVYRANNKGV